MRILVDQNLPRRLVRSLEATFPGSAHVNSVGLGGARDIDVWRFAVEYRFDIMSRDADLPMLAVRRAEDVCVVWVRLGNLALRRLLVAIERSLADLHRALGTRSMRVVEIRGDDQGWTPE